MTQSSSQKLEELGQSWAHITLRQFTVICGPSDGIGSQEGIDRLIFVLSPTSKVAYTMAELFSAAAPVAVLKGKRLPVLMKRTFGPLSLDWRQFSDYHRGFCIQRANEHDAEKHGIALTNPQGHGL